MPNDPHTHQKKNNEKRSFYIALSVCLLAAVAAAWSTYASVMDYVRSSQPTIAGTSSLPAAVSTPKPVSSAPAEESSVPALSSAEEEEESSSDVPTATESEEAVEAAAYTVSTHFTPPAMGEILSHYSGDTLVYNRTMRDWRTHPGCDIACEEGESILACANGEVTRTYTDALWGNVVEVEHGEYTLRYCGVGEEFMVSAGDVVRQGQVIALVTAVPCEAAQPLHVHLEAEKNGQAIDPAALFE